MAGHTPPQITLGHPIHGWATLTVNGHGICGVSYINPYLIDDLIDFLQAEMDERDLTIRIDREERGMAYLTSTQMQELLVVTDDGDVHLADQFTDCDEVRACACALADSIEQDLDGWAHWQCAEDDDDTYAEALEAAKADVREKVATLRDLRRARDADRQNDPKETPTIDIVPRDGGVALVVNGNDMRAPFDDSVIDMLIDLFDAMVSERPEYERFVQSRGMTLSAWADGGLLALTLSEDVLRTKACMFEPRMVAACAAHIADSIESDIEGWVETFAWMEEERGALRRCRDTTRYLMCERARKLREIASANG